MRDNPLFVCVIVFILYACFNNSGQCFFYSGAACPAYFMSENNPSLYFQPARAQAEQLYTNVYFFVCFAKQVDVCFRDVQ